MKKVEYRVRPTTRFSVTRWYTESNERGDSGGCESFGEFDNESIASTVMDALANRENKALGTVVKATENSISWKET